MLLSSPPAAPAGSPKGPSRKNSKAGMKRPPALFLEPKKVLGHLVVVLGSGSLHAQLKGIDPKLQCTVRVEGGAGETEPASNTIQTWNTEFRFPVSEYFTEVEVCLNTSRVDLVTQETRWIKDASTLLDVDLRQIVGKGPQNYDIKIKGKGTKPIAEVNLTIEYLPDPNPYEPLEKIFLENTDTLMHAVLDTFRSDEEQLEVARAFLQLYWFNCQETQLLRLAIKHEVQHVAKKSENPAELLRGSTLGIKLLSEYLRIMGEPYLQDLLVPLVRPLTQSIPKFEVDPTKLDPDFPEKEMKKHQKNLTTITQKFLKKITASASKMPSDICELCKYLKELVDERFPGKDMLALGALIFLRFICPAIVSPTAFGLVSGDCAPQAQRCLILVTKVLQNLVNEVEFGYKEEYMRCMNPFLEKNRQKAAEFYTQILKQKETAPYMEERLTMRGVPDDIYKRVFTYVDAHQADILRAVDGNLGDKLHVILDSVRIHVEEEKARIAAAKAEAERKAAEKKMKKAMRKAKKKDGKLNDSKQSGGESPILEAAGSPRASSETPRDADTLTGEESDGLDPSHLGSSAGNNGEDRVHPLGASGADVGSSRNAKKKRSSSSASDLLGESSGARDSPETRKAKRLSLIKNSKDKQANGVGASPDEAA